MEFLHAIGWGYVVAGFVVGTLVGLTGVGGGSLMTPILILIFGIQPVAAVGTDLLYAAATKSAGSLVHGFNRMIDWRVVGRLSLGSVPAAAVMLIMLHFLGIAGGTANVSGLQSAWCRAAVHFGARWSSGASCFRLMRIGWDRSTCAARATTRS